MLKIRAIVLIAIDKLSCITGKPIGITNISHYKQTTLYDRSSQFTMYWDDPALKLWWPVANPILSQRDMGWEDRDYSREEGGRGGAAMDMLRRLGIE